MFAALDERELRSLRSTDFSVPELVPRGGSSNASDVVITAQLHRARRWRLGRGGQIASANVASGRLAFDYAEGREHEES